MDAKSEVAKIKNPAQLRRLVESGAAEAKEITLNLARDESATSSLRATAIQLVGQYYSDSFTQILPLLKTGNTNDVRGPIIGVVDIFKITRALDAIKDIANDPNETAEIRSLAIRTLVHHDRDAGRPLLVDVVKNKSLNHELRIRLLLEFYPQSDEQDRDLLLGIINDLSDRQEVRADAIQRLIEVTSIENNWFEDLVKNDKSYSVQRSAIRALSFRGNEDSGAVDLLIEMSKDENLPRGMRLEMISELAKHSQRKDVRAITIDAIVNEPGFGSHSSFRIGKETNWKDVFNEFVEALKNSGKRGSQIDAAGIIRSLRGSTWDPKAPPFVSSGVDSGDLQEAIIEAAINSEGKMASVFARLLVEAADGDQSKAAASIDTYKNKHDTPAEKLKDLRVAVGGEALDEVMKSLKENLEDRFYAPIELLNTDTQNMWKQTIKHAQMGFIARILMSIVVFAVGILLLLVSSYQFLTGNISGEALFGPGVSFVSGLSMTLLVIYKGPLTEIRQSVNDLGIANASFIGYVHRVLQISHTFSYHYLQKQMTFEAMGKSSKLLQEAMVDINKALRIKPKTKEKNTSVNSNTSASAESTANNQESEKHTEGQS